MYIAEVAFLHVTGYHKYKSAWSPTVARKLLRLTMKLTNPQDPLTMAVIKKFVLGHVPRTVSQTVPVFLWKW